MTHALSALLTTHSDGQPYLRFANADGKQWLMPQHCLSMAMQLYQPSGRKGKWLKRLLPYLHWLPFVRQTIKAEVVHLSLTTPFERVLQRLFGHEPLDIAIFCGTPSIHQKATLQVSRGQRILGYCKVSDKAEVITLFEQEADTLRYLHEKGVTNVPQCLYCDSIGEGIGLFIQSTDKTLEATTTHHWSLRESNFLRILHEHTMQSLLYDSTDFAADMRYLANHLHTLPEAYHKALHQALNHVTPSPANTMVDFSFYHGDFTPWNSYIVQERLYLFDLEYAKRTYPRYLDFWHFYTQTAIFEQGWDADTIMQHVPRAAQESKLFHALSTDGQGGGDMYQSDMAEKSYLAYLLAIVAHYTQRERGQFEGALSAQITLWLTLIQHLTSNIQHNHDIANTHV